MKLIHINRILFIDDVLMAVVISIIITIYAAIHILIFTIKKTSSSTLAIAFFILKMNQEHGVRRNNIIFFYSLYTVWKYIYISSGFLLVMLSLLWQSTLTTELRDDNTHRSLFLCYIAYNVCIFNSVLI